MFKKNIVTKNVNSVSFEQGGIRLFHCGTYECHKQEWQVSNGSSQESPTHAANLAT